MKMLKICIIILSHILCLNVIYAQLYILKTDISPVIDGQRDAIWGTAPNNSIQIPVEVNPPTDRTDFSGEYRMLWNEEGLYILVTVRDDLLRTDQKDPSLWYENDAIEFYLDGGNEKNKAYDDNDVQCAIVYGASELSAVFNGADRTNFTLNDFTGCICKSKQQTFGYTTEIKIPSAILHDKLGINIIPGNEFGWEIALQDNDSGTRDHKLNWINRSDTTWNQPDKWGTATLVEDIYPFYEIRHTNNKPVIDGNFDDLWNIAIIENLSYFTWGSPASKDDLSAEYRMLWDNDSLYLLVSVMDDNVRADNNGYWWQNDALEFYFDGGNNKNAQYDENDIEFGYIFGDKKCNYTFASPDNGLRPENFNGFHIVSSGTDNGYTIELAMPADQLNQYLAINLAANTEFGWEIAIHDNDTGVRNTKLAWWSFDDFSWTTATRWGKAKLMRDIDYPGSITVEHTVDFPVKTSPTDYTGSDYKIFGLPGASNLQISSLLTGKREKDWQIFWDNGQAANYLIPCDGGDRFACKAGRAFWILSTNPLRINTRQITAAPLNEKGRAEIELHQGWNLITNPYRIPISWLRIKEANHIPLPSKLWSFEGTFNSEVRIIESYKGYYFNNNTDPPLESLEIPFIQADPKLQEPVSEAGYLWKVDINLECEEIVDRSAYIALDKEAGKELDAFEYSKPRGAGAIPSVYFHRPEWNSDYPDYANDVRPSTNTIEEWTFNVQAPKNQEAELSFTGIEDIPEAYSVYLINHNNEIFIDLQEQSTYKFKPAKNISSFSILIGDADKVEHALQKIVPIEFALHQNFPNPFNPETTIPFTLPTKSFITIKIYSLLGREIKTLISKSYEAGTHYLSWDGCDQNGFRVASGIYIYRMTTAAGENFKRKLILLK